MTPHPVRFTGLTALAAILLALAAYWVALGSDHAATNGDELLYAQITQATAATGHWLPLQSLVERHRNTKPPALFWQGIVSTDWAKNWSLWNLRYPNVLYTLAIAVLVFLLAGQLGRDASTGLIAALAFLCFFGTYRYGRVFLTSAPETFWLFLPFAFLLFRRDPYRCIGWVWSLLFGLMFGAALLYKSFALAAPAMAGLAWWTLHLRGYHLIPWMKRDVWQVALTGLVSLGVFSLWYWFDPQRHLILDDFILDENVGKFDPKGGNYFLNLIWGESSIWRNVISYPLNAGLLAPAVIAVMVLAFLRRRHMPLPGQLLWIWIITVFVVFTLPNQRDERYLLPAMPALAVLTGLFWTQIPRWILGITLVAVAVITLGMGLGAALLTNLVAGGSLYPYYYWVLIGGTIAVACAGLVRLDRTHMLACPAILLLYLCYAGFLIPFEGPRGQYDAAAQAFAEGKTLAVPINHGAREEIYRFMLPPCDLQPYKQKPHVDLAYLKERHPIFIISMPLTDTSVEEDPSLRLLGQRLNLVDRFRPHETADMLRGNVTRHLFKKDLLVERVDSEN